MRLPVRLRGVLLRLEAGRLARLDGRPLRLDDAVDPRLGDAVPGSEAGLRLARVDPVEEALPLVLRDLDPRGRGAGGGSCLCCRIRS